MSAASEQSLLARVLADDTAEDEADGTASRILDGALAQLQDFGLRRTSMEDVARRARVARVTIYRRFDNKNALVEAVLLREVRRFLKVFTATIEGLTSIEDQVAETFVVTLRFARGHELLHRLLTTEPETLLPYLTVCNGPFLAVARAFLAEGLRRGDGVAPQVAEDAEAAAETLIRLMLSFVLGSESCVPLEDEEAARTYARRHLAPIVTRG